MDIKDKKMDALKRALAGTAYQTIADDYGISRERVRQWCEQLGYKPGWKAEQRAEFFENLKDKILKDVCSTGNLAKTLEQYQASYGILGYRGIKVKKIKCYLKAKTEHLSTCKDCGIKLNGYRYARTLRCCLPCGRLRSKLGARRWYAKRRALAVSK